jgi:hypothetical protein
MAMASIAICRSQGPAGSWTRFKALEVALPRSQEWVENGRIYAGRMTSYLGLMHILVYIYMDMGLNVKLWEIHEQQGFQTPNQFESIGNCPALVRSVVPVKLSPQLNVSRPFLRSWQSSLPLSNGTMVPWGVTSAFSCTSILRTAGRAQHCQCNRLKDSRFNYLGISVIHWLPSGITLTMLMVSQFQKEHRP